MRKYITILAITVFLFACELNKSGVSSEKKDYQERFFDFSNSEQLVYLPSHGTDPSRIEQEQLVCPILCGEHKGLGKKFHFEEYGAEPDSAEIDFSIWIDSDFQRNGVSNECGKLPGFEGIYDLSAGWGGRKVTNQPSWSVRIGHGGENAMGEIPLALYVYHPGMIGKYGTTIDLNHSIKKEHTYRLKLFLKMNEIGKENGVMKFYVDGNQIYDSADWLFRTEPAVHIKSVWLDIYIGGGTPSLFDTYVLLDNLKIKW